MTLTCKLVNIIELFNKRGYEMAKKGKKLFNYRVISTRWDVPQRIVSNFTAHSDEEAKSKFEIFKSDPRHQCDRLKLIRYEETIIETWEKRQ